MEKTIPGKPKILYVDDIETNLILFEHTFKNDYEIFLAESGAEGLELLRQHNFVALITDQRMPGMSGNELLEIVSVEFPDVMRFLLTAYSDYDILVEAINKGQIYGFFNKPFKAQEVKMVLNKAIEVYQLREKNKQMVKDLEMANKELKTIDQSKTRFLSAITDEIKSPVRKITSAIHMLKDKIDSRDLTDLLNYVDLSIAKLENFSSMTTRLAQLRDGTFKMDVKEIVLRELIEVCFIESNEELKEKGISLKLEEENHDLTIKGDFDLLLTCIRNILQNAIRHTSKEGTVTVLLSARENRKYCTIIDEGKDYSNHQIQNLISLYTSNVNSLDNEAGIELVLARQIMESHEGFITIESMEDSRISLNLVF